MQFTKSGIGVDFHRFENGRSLFIGGVEIPYNKGLIGHSDADVLLHAISDALLGAASLGDIGIHFPDTDPRYKDISSKILLRRVKGMVRKRQFQIGHIDAMVVAEEPILLPYFDEMKREIARALDIELDQINIKATKAEGLGAIGAGEGIMAQAIASIYPLGKEDMGER
jgi:2-C-methyl-D-erythritol 2,4-cyclodiphosphate synthase